MLPEQDRRDTLFNVNAAAAPSGTSLAVFHPTGGMQGGFGHLPPPLPLAATAYPPLGTTSASRSRASSHSHQGVHTRCDACKPLGQEYVAAGERHPARHMLTSALSLTARRSSSAATASRATKACSQSTGTRASHAGTPKCPATTGVSRCRAVNAEVLTKPLWLSLGLLCRGKFPSQAP